MNTYKNIVKALKRGNEEELVILNQKVDFITDIHFHRMEDLLKETESKLPPFRLFHYILAFFVTGSGQKTIGNYSFRIVPNLAIIVPKNIVQSTTDVKEKIEGYVVSFKEDLFNQINLPLSFLELNKLFHFSRNPYAKASPEISDKIIYVYKQIEALKNSSYIFDEKMMGVKLIELILLYHKLFQTDRDNIPKTNFLFDQFVNNVEKSFRHNRNVEWYAEKIGVDPGHLNKTVQKHTGNSAKYYIQNRVFFEAKYLLTSTKISIKEIAFELGFHDYNYFTRHFKSFVGCTPGNFRKQQI